MTHVPSKTRQSTPLTIAYVAPGFPPRLGGIETHVAELSRRAAEAGHRIEVLTQDGRGRTTVERTPEGVTVRRFPSYGPSAYPVAPGLFVHLRRNAARYSLLHAHNFHALSALAAALASGPPLVFTPQYIGHGHARGAAILHQIYRPAARFIVRRSAVVICVSSSEAEALSAALPEVAGRVTLIPNGVDLEVFRGAEPFPLRQKVVLAVARLEPYKGISRIIEATARLGPDFTVVVAGEGPQRGELERLAVRLGLGDRALFVGHIDHAVLSRWYATAAVYVTMSPRESYNITLIEAVAAGVPVVAIHTPVHAEVLERARWRCSNLLDANASADVLATAIEQLASVDVARYEPPVVPTWDEVWLRTQAVYETLLDGRR